VSTKSDLTRSVISLGQEDAEAWFRKIAFSREAPEEAEVFAQGETVEAEADDTVEVKVVKRLICQIRGRQQTKLSASIP
jgi:hypothetical protein